MPVSSAPISNDSGPRDSIAGYSDLESLLHRHCWFDLRDAVCKLTPRGVYRSAVACAFNEFSPFRDDLFPILKSGLGLREAYQAHDLLAWFYLRKGKFQHALAHVEAMLAMRPDESGPQAIRSLLSFLCRYPQQSVRPHQRSILSWTMVDGNMFIPVVVNGNPANYMMDSGATISMMTQSEARRLKLAVEKPGTDAVRLYGATGLQVEFSIAVAHQLDIGDCRLSHVSFLVLNDDQFQFPPEYAGAIGLSVLIQLQTLCWSADGTVRIESPSQPYNLSTANVCFDGPEPITEAVFQDQRLPLVLDTGSAMTILGPAFAAKFAKFVHDYGSRDSILLNGISGSAHMESMRLSTIVLRMGGFDATLHPAHVLLKATTPNSNWLFGRLGMDLLQQAKRVRLDFHCMRLTLE